ncbi:MAG: DUF6198 family protein [Oscillospiraceae bacterium]|nr:DUF6198 family protein [Oscillospiraceae bacterium]
MCGKERVKRYAVLLAGLLICAFGVALITKASLGTSPSVAISYSLSLVFENISLGTWLVIYQAALITAEIIMLRRQTRADDIIVQAVLAVTFGYLVDFFMLLLGGLEPVSYLTKLIFLLLGCAVMAFGIYIELTADVGMLSYDAFVRVTAKLLKKDYGKVRTAIDVIFVAIAAAISLVFERKLLGVREGTIIAAIVAGQIVRVYTRLFRGLPKRIFRT